MKKLNENELSKWDKRFYELAKHIATWSKDPSTQVGAIIITPNKRIVATGYNGMPTNINDFKYDRWARPTKYMWVEHAERNAIYHAARHGTSIEGCSLYVTTFPCADCARAIIQSGISCLIAPYYTEDKKWIKSWKVSEEMLIEAKIGILAIIKE